MKVKGVDPDSGTVYEAETESVNEEYIQSLQDSFLSDDEIKRLIDKLNVSADAKSLLYKFSKATISAGEFVVKVGRKILDIVFKIMQDFPKTTFLMIFGAIAGYLITHIPVIGAALGAIFTPLAMILGIALGVALDINDSILVGRIARMNEQFNPLKA